VINILNVDKSLLVPSTNGKTFPPQNKSENTIEYLFYKHVQNNDSYSSNLDYLPIQWENSLHDNLIRDKIKSSITNLQKDSKKMFTLSRLTGGPMVNLNNCIIFTTGGIFNMPKNQNLSYVPLPLIADKYTDIPTGNKKYIASYIGRNTHPIRVDLEKFFKRDKNYYVKNLNDMHSEFDSEKQEQFKKIISESYFSLAPRGFGPTSFRLYESIELGVVPVYIGEDFLLPFSEIIDWEKLCVLVRYEDLKNLKKILSEIIDSNRYIEMINYGKYCEEKYFNNNFTFKYITDFVSKF
jgi:hypothetical protein